MFERHRLRPFSPRRPARAARGRPPGAGAGPPAARAAARWRSRCRAALPLAPDRSPRRGAWASPPSGRRARRRPPSAHRPRHNDSHCLRARSRERTLRRRPTIVTGGGGCAGPCGGYQRRGTSPPEELANCTTMPRACRGWRKASDHCGAHRKHSRHRRGATGSDGHPVRSGTVARHPGRPAASGSRRAVAPAIALRPQARLPPAWGRSHGAAVGRGGVLAMVQGRGQRCGATRWRRAQGGPGRGTRGRANRRRRSRSRSLRAPSARTGACPS